jgi:hypothetical protein
VAEGIPADNQHFVLLFFIAQLFLRELAKCYRLVQVIPMDMTGYYGKTWLRHKLYYRHSIDSGRSMPEGASCHEMATLCCNTFISASDVILMMTCPQRCCSQTIACSPDIITTIKLRGMRSAGNIACMGRNRNAYKLLALKSERKSHLRRSDYMSGIILRCILKK